MFSIGSRLFRAGPIFSQAGQGSKHKFERFLQPGDFVVATIYAPIVFPPAPVLIFKLVFVAFIVVQRMNYSIAFYGLSFFLFLLSSMYVA